MAYNNQYIHNPYPNFGAFTNPGMHVTMSEPQQDPIDNILKGISPMYVYYQRVLAEVKQTMQKYGFGVTIRKNPANLDFITLRGGIQTSFKGSYMRITLLIMFPYDYPFGTPLGFVEPENDKELIPHHGIVFPDYSIRHYMLRNWNSNENIPGLIDILCRDFAGNSPLQPKPQFSLYPNQNTTPTQYPQMAPMSPHRQQNPMYYSSPNPQMYGNPYQQATPINSYPDLSQRSKPLPSIPNRTQTKSPNQLHIQQDIQQQMNSTCSQQGMNNVQSNGPYQRVPYQPKEKPLPPIPSQSNQMMQMNTMNQRPREQSIQQQQDQRSIGNTNTTPPEMKKSLPSVSSINEFIDISGMELDDPDDVQKHGGLPALQSTERQPQIEGFAPFKSDNSQPTITHFPQLSSVTSDLKSFVLGFFDPSRKPSNPTSSTPMNPHNK